MKTVEQLLNEFNGKRVHAIAKNMMCVEDIDKMREILIKKHGRIDHETPRGFKIGDKVYPKPRVIRERIGTLIDAGDQYYILNEMGERSYAPVNMLIVENDTTLAFIFDQQKDYRIEYQLI